MVGSDDLTALSSRELIQLVRELRAANPQLHSAGAATPPAAAQLLLDDQLRRSSLLTQLAIEFRETLDTATIVEQTLRAIVTHLVLAGASIVLIGPNNTPELAISAAEGLVYPIDQTLAHALVEHGLAGWVLRHGSSVALSDVARDRRWLQFSEQHSSGSLIVIPLRQSSATLGVLTVHRALPYAFTSHDLILLEGVAAQLGVALSASRHQLSERTRRDQAMDLLAMSQFLSAEHNPAEVAAMLQEKSATVFGARYGLLFLAEADGAEPALRAVLPPQGAPDTALIHHCGGAAKLAWGSQRIVTTVPAPGLTCVAMPLTHHGVTIGAFAQIHSGTASFPANVWSLLNVFSHVVAAACANMGLVARLTEQTKLLEGLVEQRTHQLQRSRDLLRMVFDSMPEGILLLDAEERLVAANTVFCQQIVGIHPRELVGQSYSQVWQALERRARVQIDLAPNENGRQRLNVRCSGPTGAWQFLVDRTPIGGENGQADQYLEFWREIRE